jgi:hypothetical protein
VESNEAKEESLLRVDALEVHYGGVGALYYSCSHISFWLIFVQIETVCGWDEGYIHTPVHQNMNVDEGCSIGNISNWLYSWWTDATKTWFAV